MRADFKGRRQAILTPYSEYVNSTAVPVPQIAQTSSYRVCPVPHRTVLTGMSHVFGSLTRSVNEMYMHR